MSNKFAYFIGGPKDLTKMAMPQLVSSIEFTHLPSLDKLYVDCENGWEPTPLLYTIQKRTIDEHGNHIGIYLHTKEPLITKKVPTRPVPWPKCQITEY